MLTKRVLCCLASGFACLEVIPLVALLAEAGISLDFANVDGISESRIISEYGVSIDSVPPLAKLADGDYAALIIPGGKQALGSFQSSLLLFETVAQFQRSNRIIAAIGLAPAGILVSSKLFFEANMTGHPATMPFIPQRQWQPKRVVWDARFKLITSQGAGTAMDFSLKIIERIAGKAVAKQVAAPLILAPGIYDYQQEKS